MLVIGGGFVARTPIGKRRAERHKTAMSHALCFFSVVFHLSAQTPSRAFLAEAESRVRISAAEFKSGTRRVVVPCKEDRRSGKGELARARVGILVSNIS